MGKEIKLSHASWKDFSQVMSLEKECFPLDVWPMLDVLGVLSFPKFVRIKAEDENKLVGFIAGEIKKTYLEGWVSTIGVLPSYRRLGIGKKLLAACEKDLNVLYVKLSVRETSHGAIRFYEEMGYTGEGMWKRYYKGGEDALIMRKQIEK